MSRVKTGPIRRRRHKRLLKKAEGYRGARHRLFRTAKEAVGHAKSYAFAGRKQRKRQIRRSWIMDINAAARAHGLTYRTLLTKFQEKNIPIDRKKIATTIREHPESVKEFLEKGTFFSDANAKS